MKRLIPVVLLCCCSAVSARAASDSSASFSLSVVPSGTLSYTGINGHFLLQLRYGRHELYAGPKASFSKSYLPDNAVWGYNAGYNFSVLKSRHLEMLANFDFQEIFYRPYSLRRTPSTNRNTVSEYLAGLALRYRPSTRIPFGMQVNISEGIYRDKYHSAYRNDGAVNYGISSMVRLSFMYTIIGR